MGKSAPTPPPAPDPVAVSQAQAQANIETAREQQRLNMVGSSGPQGSVGWVADPTQPGGYRQVTSLSQPEQQSYDLSKQAENAALGVANSQIGRVGEALSTPLSTAGLPELSGSIPGAGQGIQSSFDKGRALQYGFDPGQQVQGQVGGDLDAARYQNMAAVYQQAASRLDPRFDREQRALEQRLADQGLSTNSEAYANAQRQFSEGKNDAYNQAIYSAVGAGEDAANSMFGRQLQQGQFANQAAAQMYGQNMGQAEFWNQTAGQDYGQNLGAAQFNNAAQQQQFQQQLASAQFGNEARQQGLQERAYLQNQPINQFTALMSSGQVGMPEGIGYTPSQVANTDVLGAYALNQQAQQSAYQAQAANQRSGLSGLFSLGAAALAAPMTGGGSLAGALGSRILSDARLKTDIRRVGALDNGVGVYAYRYLGGETVHVGVLAQELAQVRPDAVHDMGGFLAVDYGAL